MNTTDPRLLESLSGLYDGALPADESRFLMRRLESDASLRAVWTRWSIASAALRRQDQRLLPAGFAERVMASTAEEVVGGAGRSAASAASRPWLRWAGGMAMAASAAVIALFANAPDSTLPGGEAPNAQVAASNLRETDLRPRINPAATVAAEAVGPVVSFAPERDGLSPELQDYMIRHNAMLQEAGISGFVPYLDVIAHPPAAMPAAESAR